MPHLMPCIYSHNTWGGIEKWLIELVTHLRSEGWEITIGLARGQVHNDPQAFRNAYPGFSYVEFDGRVGTRHARVESVMRELRRVRPDIVVPLGVVEAFGAAEAIKREGVPLRVVATLHTLLPEAFADVREFAPFLDLCVAVNPVQYRFLSAQEEFTRDQLRCVPHGISSSNCESRRDSTGSLRLVYAGRLAMTQKRVLDSVDLVAELESLGVDFKLSFAGSGPAEQELKQALKTSVDSGKVSFLGYQPHDTLLDVIFPAHEVLLIFSDEEAGPLVMLEAMSKGVVPVSSEFIGVHSQGWLQPEESGLLFPVGDSSSAARCIQKLAVDRQLLNLLSSNARSLASDVSLKKSNDQWNRVLLELLEKPVVYPPSTFRSPFAQQNPAGRIERLGLSPRIANRLRQALGRKPHFQNGWEEWPGTLSSVGASGRAAMLDELRRLDRAAQLSYR